MIFALLFMLALVLFLSPLEAKFRKRRRLEATTPAGTPRVRAWAYAIFGFLAVGLLSSMAVAAASSPPPDPTSPVNQVAFYGLLFVLACRALSNVFPPNTIAYKVLHALGAGTGAEAVTAQAAHAALTDGSASSGSSSSGSGSKSA